MCTLVETNARFPRIDISTGTDIASSFCIPAEAVVSSLKHVRAGSFAPVFVAIDTRSAAAFGKNSLPTAMHVPVLAEDAVSIAYFCVSNSVSLCCVLRSYRSETVCPIFAGPHTSPPCEPRHLNATGHREAFAAQWQKASVSHHVSILRRSSARRAGRGHSAYNTHAQAWCEVC